MTQFALATSKNSCNSNDILADWEDHSKSIYAQVEKKESEVKELKRTITSLSLGNQDFVNKIKNGCVFVNTAKPGSQPNYILEGPHVKCISVRRFINTNVKQINNISDMVTVVRAPSSTKGRAASYYMALKHGDTTQSRGFKTHFRNIPSPYRHGLFYSSISPSYEHVRALYIQPKGQRISIQFILSQPEGSDINQEWSADRPIGSQSSLTFETANPFTTEKQKLFETVINTIMYEFDSL